MKHNKEVRKIILSVTRGFGVKVRIKPMEETTRGVAYYTRNLINLNSNFINEKPVDTSLTTLCHELGHIIAFRKGKFKKYHYTKDTLSYEERKHLCKIALRAELYVDNIGRKIFNELFPELEYQSVYNCKENQEAFKKFIREYHNL